MGPGKADLLDAIRQHGSISAAARAMGMSYRRAWLLVDVMNRCWQKPLVATAPGHSRGGGAQVTPSGEQVLARYRTLQANLRAVPGKTGEYTDLLADMRDAPKMRTADK